jgi:hypothetical protein
MLDIMEALLVKYFLKCLPPEIFATEENGERIRIKRRIKPKEMKVSLLLFL